MKLSEKIMILTLFLVIVCCISSVSATENVSDDISSQNLNSTIVEEINDDVVKSDELSYSDDFVLNEEGNEIYINGSKEFNIKIDEDTGDIDFLEGEGDSWETAWGNDNEEMGPDVGLMWAVEFIEPEGTIHLSDWQYPDLTISAEKNIKFIGQSRENTIITGNFNVGTVGSMDENNQYLHDKFTFVNFTFKDATLILENDKEFINCTFINSAIIFGQNLKHRLNDDLISKIDSSLIASFKNCSFVNYVTEHSYITSYQYGQINISNCTFENITADSIVYSEADGMLEDGIHISNSKFFNVTVNGIMDVDEKYATFENNEEDLNKFRLPPADSKITLNVTRQYLIVTLKDSEGNPIPNATVTLTTTWGKLTQGVLTTNNEGIAMYNYENNQGYYWWYADYDGVKSLSLSYGAAEDSVFLDINKFEKTLKVKFNNVTDVTGKTMLVVTVKNNLSEAVPNTNFTFTLNGKDYNATTDANGQFIASGLTGDVSVGVKYNGTEYNALDATSNFTFPKTESEDNTPSGNTTPTNTTPSDDKKPSQPGTPAKKVTPVATKITAKKATFKAKKKAKKYSITLKAGKKAVAKVKVTIKVGKKTYKATTNKKGKAIFNLKKLTKKGKYTAVIKFKGNKNYKATSKKVKIIVK